MKTSKRFTLYLLSLGLALASTGAIAPLRAEEQKPVLSEEEQKAIQLQLEIGAPGPMHKHLEYFVGQWQSEFKTYDDPKKEPLIHRQDISVSMIHGGRQTVAHLKGEAMGQPYDALVITGYSKHKKQFYAIQFNSMITEYFTTTGTLDSTGKIRTETGILEGDPSGEIYRIKAVTTLLDLDHYRYDLYIIQPGGQEVKNMEIFYTRQK